MASSSEPSSSTPGSTKRNADPPPGPSSESPKTPRITAEMQEEVQCPICLEVPLGVILQCVNGHTVCQPCQEKTGRQTCGQCQDQMKSQDGRWMRNRALEKMLDKMTIPCHFRDKGCTAVLPRADLKNHVKECDKSGYVIQICRYFVGEMNCDFKINCTKPQEAFQHLRDCHLGVCTKKITMILERMGTLKQLVLLSEVEQQRSRYYLLAVSADHPEDLVNFLALSISSGADDKRAIIRITFKSHSSLAADMSVEIPVVSFPNVAAALEKPAPVRVTLSFLKDHYQNPQERVEMQISVK